MVSVPVVGAFENATLPLTLYCCVNVSQPVGTAETEEMLQTVAQDGGAVKEVVKVQLGSSEKVAVTVHPAPLAGNPPSE